MDDAGPRLLRKSVRWQGLPRLAPAGVYDRGIPPKPQAAPDRGRVWQAPEE